MEVDKDKLQELVRNFFSMCGYADELNIYEWEEADMDMQSMKEFVSTNFGRHLENLK